MFTSAEKSSLAVSTPRLASGEIPAAIRQELNADTDRDLIARMRHLARKKKQREPHLTEEEMADYLALAENFEDFEQWLAMRRGAPQKRPRSGIAWIAVSAAAFGFLTTMLIVAIAITV
jgi:hypothetical protein